MKNDQTIGRLIGREPMLEESSSVVLGATEAINTLVTHTHLENAKWWIDLDTGQSKHRNVPEMLMLIVSELAEALEGHRKGLHDDKLPHRRMIEVELADALIRIFDLAGGLGLDLGGAYNEKMLYNRTRKDHTLEARRAEHGKKY